MSDRAGDILASWHRGACAGAIGEFEMIARLRRRIEAARTTAELILGPGDDAALLRPLPGWDLVLTCDAHLEGRHFRRAWASPREVGERLAQINLSDLAAMGAVPVAGLLSLGLTAEICASAIEELAGGVIAALAEREAALAGGNITASDQLLADLTLLGRVEPERALRRSGARAGQVVFVTGSPGVSAAALQTLESPGDLWERLAAAIANHVDPAALRESFRRAHVAPRAQLEVGRYLLVNELAGAVIDQSDGVAGDLAHICEQSSVGIVLVEEFLPIDFRLGALAELIGADPLAWVLGPSDDYGLLFTAPREKADLILALPQVLGVEVALIGEVVAGEPRVCLRRKEGRVEPLGGGWDHLRRPSGREAGPT